MHTVLPAMVRRVLLNTSPLVENLGTLQRSLSGSIADRMATNCVYGFSFSNAPVAGPVPWGIIKMMDVHGSYPQDIWELLDFYPEAKQRLPLPKEVPVGIKREFREAEICSESRCYRAAAAMLRSVLDKTLRANGYNPRENKNLKQQIDAAAADGVITKARQKRAHDEVRVLGNDVLHDDWHEIEEDDVEVSRLYLQRLLEDFYDDRPSVLALLTTAGRSPEELKPKADKDALKK